MEAAAQTQESASTPQTASQASPDVVSNNSTPAKVDLNKPVIKEAIARGLALIQEGKSKADAAWDMFSTIKEEPKDVIVAAFVAGATLTEKGSLTYWYNCKKKAKKLAASTA